MWVRPKGTFRGKRFLDYQKQRAEWWEVETQDAARQWVTVRRIVVYEADKGRELVPAPGEQATRRVGEANALKTCRDMQNEF